MIVPRFTQERCLILTDADVESLLASAMAAEQQSLTAADPSVLLPAWWDVADDDLDLLISAIDPAVLNQARMLGLNAQPQHALYPPDEDTRSGPQLGQLQSRILTEAAYLALSVGIKKVVWPIRIPTDHPDRIQAIGDTIDRAMLIARLVTLDATTDTAPEVSIDTPFVDLNDDQIFELARDMPVPLETCWWNAAPTLAAAQQRKADWNALTNRSALQIEPKPGTQTPA
jgi:hypothetical protein